MAEIEIHHAHGHDEDAFGKRVGVIVGLIGIVLAAVTINSHRAHTAAVIYRTEANDQWSYYQAKKIRENAAENANILLKALSNDAAKQEPVLAKLEEKREHYAKDAEKTQDAATEKERETHHAEDQALRFDLGEGLLELGMVLSSLYFLSKRKLFPFIGISAAAAGMIIGVSGLDAVNNLFAGMPWHFA